MRIETGVATDIGRVREGNEDSYLVEPPLYAVADGMGGHRGGEVASHLALETVEERARADQGTLADQVRAANRAVYERSQQDREVTGMGTTLTAAKLVEGTLLLAHVGDSRAYLLRGGALRQLTDDHTLVNRMVKAGEITTDEADVHPHRNVLTRALGTEPEVQVDVSEVPLMDGDRALLCSDGLFGMVTEDQIQAILEVEPDPQKAAERLIRAANSAGGVDNITVVVLDARRRRRDGRRRRSGARAVSSQRPRGPALPDALGYRRGARTPDPGRRVLRRTRLRGLPVVRGGGERARRRLPGHPGGAARVPPLARRGADRPAGRGRAEAGALRRSVRRHQRGEPGGCAGRRRPDAQGPAGEPAPEGGRGAVSAAAIEAAKPQRAKTGLGLLILALVVSVGAFAVAGLGLEGKVPPQTVVYGVLYTAAFLGAWAVVRWTARGADPVLLPVAAILGGLGIAMLYRIMVDRGQPEIWIQQAGWLFVGLAAFVLTLLLVREDRRLDAYTYTIGLAGVILLLLPVVPGIGYQINGARLWARIGPLSFQPAEFGKILIVIFLASYLASKRELLASGVGRLGMPRGKDLGPLLLAWGASLAVLFLERDMGASLLFFGVFVVMLWIAERPLRLPRDRRAALRAGRLYRIPRVQSRTAARGLLAARARPRPRCWGSGTTSSPQGWFALASGGLVGTGIGAGFPHADPVRGERDSSSRPSARSSGCWGPPGCCSSTWS